ncbi:methionyl-tRNA formyltransferase [Lentisalinibacter salinarum]|uniref:methionyl-tRNA formyltransferase n=1 Tax=Lentisalinibacter salinarum TaxID=2992239 RepID=UPI00386E2B04
MTGEGVAGDKAHAARASNTPRLIFAGTPGFALASLQALCGAGHRPVAVLTQPDRPAGRGRRLTPSPVKAWAVAEGLPVLQPATLKDAAAVAELAALAPDALIVAAYGLILPADVLELPPAGCINVHASLLPRWRGASPIQAAVLAGDPVSGVSLMRMEPGLDTGPVYARAEAPVGARETAGELHDRLAALGAGLLTERLPDILAGRLQPEPQDDAAATYAPRIRREDALIDWSWPAERIDRAVRAYDPWPVCHTRLEDELLRCWRAEPLPAGDQPPAEPGVILAAGADGIDVATGDGVLRLLEVQLPGRRRIAARDFANQRLANRRGLAGLRLG